MQKNKLFVIIVLVLFLLAMVPSSHGMALIDFADGDAAGLGEVWFDGQGNTWGSAVGIDRMTLFGIPAFPTPSNFDVSGTVANVDPDAGRLDFDTRPGNNHFMITGGIPDLNVSHQVLLYGTFLGWEITNHGIEGAYGIDQKSNDLLQAIGLPIGMPFDFFGFALTTGVLVGQPNLPVSVDIKNTPVPEPQAIFLILSGIGALAACGFIKRKPK